jgi:hypothetical protein
MSTLTRNKIGQLFVALALLLMMLAYAGPTSSFPVSVSAQTSYKSATVPAPKLGEKKVVLKNLGMT